MSPIIRTGISRIIEIVIQKLRHSNSIPRSLQRVYNRYRKKTIAVIGPPASGKTTLLEVLRNSNISPEDLKEYNKTEIEDFETFSVNFPLPVADGEQVRFRSNVRKNVDVGGEEYVRNHHWSKAIREASVVVYLFDAEKFFRSDNGGYQKRILADFDWLSEHIQLLKPSFSIVLAANKIDLLCTRENFHSFVETHKPCLQELRKTILDRWPKGYDGNFKGLPFLTLMQFRNISLHCLIASFAWDLLSEDERKYLKSQGITA